MLAKLPGHYGCTVILSSSLNWICMKLLQDSLLTRPSLLITEWLLLPITKCLLSKRVDSESLIYSCYNSSVSMQLLALTRCSSFLRLTGGCSCNTESARTFRVASTIFNVLCRGAKSWGGDWLPIV